MTEMQMNSVRQFIDYAKRVKQSIIEYAQAKGVTIDSLIEAIRMAFEENSASCDRLAVERVIKLIQQKELILSDLDKVIRMLSEEKVNSDTMPATTATAESKESNSNGMVTSVPAKKVSQAPKKDLESLVTEIIKEVGVPAHIKGYHYLRYALIYLAERKIASIAMTKELYPAVAKEFRATSSKVERAMRHAVTTAWKRGKVETLERYFGYTIDPERGKPTNKEFICKIADYLKHL